MMNFRARVWILILSQSALVACGVSVHGPGASVSAEKSDTKVTEQYKFTENGCSTEEHIFTENDAASARHALCEALKNDELNHHCALQSRKEYFREKCPGETWPAPAPDEEIEDETQDLTLDFTTE